MRGLLRDRFENFEPEAPELFDTIAGARHTAAKRDGHWYIPGMISVMLLLSYPVNEQLLSHRVNVVPEQAYLPEPAAAKPVNQPIRRSGQGHKAELPVTTQRDILTKSALAPNYTTLSPPAMKFSSGLTIPIIARLEGPPEEKPRMKERAGRLSVHGALGMNYTQYLLTVLPQENLAIDNLTLADPGDRVNWRLQGSVGIDYDQWQLRISYQEFTQKLNFLENRGNAQVEYSDTGHYTVTPLAAEVSSRKNFRVAGLYLRRLQPVKSTGLYIGAGAGYLVGLKREHQGVWGQAFAGHRKRLSPTMEFFYETQFNYSFRPFRLTDPSLTFWPYQVGLSAGIRWNAERN